MGVCQSCLGICRKDHSSTQAETARLLSEDPFQTPYGSTQFNDGQHQRASARAPGPDAEEIQRMRVALEQICVETTDKFIDVSQPSNTDIVSQTTVDYARLFKEAFPSPANPHGRIRSGNGSQPKGEGNAEQAWLKEIIDLDPSGRSWDCNTVHKIDRPLVFNFDEFLKAP